MSPRMKLALALVTFAVTLAFTATTILYFTGPTTKIVKDRSWQGRRCVQYGPVEVGEPLLSNCISWAPPGYVTESNTARTSAWERISGAVTGSGDVEAAADGGFST